jgi:glutathione S-transferase
MKLHHSSASQYVRKVMVVAIELGLDGRIELITDKKDLEKHNPLLKRPALITDDGDCIIDSPVICAYLDRLAGGRLIPAEGRAHWKALSLEALGDGIMEAISAIRVDRAFHPDGASKAWHDRQILKVVQGLDALEAEAAGGGFAGPLTIGQITAAVLCGYIDFTFAECDWRAGRPALAAWYEHFSKRPSMTRTVPRQSEGGAPAPTQKPDKSP